MFDKLLGLLTGTAVPPTSGADELQLAVAALLVEAATMDNVFDDAERSAITRLLSARFNLTDAATEDLLQAATLESAKSVQLFGFTRGIAKHLDYEQRVQIIEMLWEIAYADNVLTAEEDSMIRRVAGLIHVSDRDRGEARKRVLEKTATRGPWSS